LIDPYIRSIKKLLQGKNPQSIIVFKYFDTFLNAGRLKVKASTGILLRNAERLFPYLDPLFDVERFANITVHFIRARSNLILSCSSESFPICIRYSVGRGRGMEQGMGKGERERGSIVKTSSDYLRLTSQFSIIGASIFYLCYLRLAVSLFRLSECFCISIASLYFLGKYDVVVAIVDVLSNNIWWPVSMLCFDNCVMCFSLTYVFDDPEYCQLF